MKSKIVVFKMSDLIKKSIFVFIGVLVLIFIMGIFMHRDNGTYNSGTYQSNIILHSKPVSLSVTIEKGMIKSIDMLDLTETQKVFYPTFDQCFEEISNSVIENQSTEIDIPKDYEFTGEILLSAIDNALEDAKK